MKIGIIGYGSMGSMLAEGFIRTGTMPGDLFISNRTESKRQALQTKGIVACTYNRETAVAADILFLCVKPMEIKPVLEEIKSVLTPDKHLVSIAGSLKIACIEKYHSGAVSRIMPTLISSIGEGVTLMAHNHRVTGNALEKLVGGFSRIRNVPESEFEILSDLTSCAPGLFSVMMREFVRAAITHTTLDEKELAALVVETMYGTARLLKESGEPFDNIISRVATKGGATEAGAAVLEQGLPQVFGEMFRKTLERQADRAAAVEKEF
jgi:pyrroline-5-carboxylate reductase